MSRILTPRPLTREAFAPFGHVLEIPGAVHYPINNGMTERHHDLAPVELEGEGARACVSIFRGQPYAFPLKLVHMERHPRGSQAFTPLNGRPWLAIVAPDLPDGEPGRPEAFLCRGDQGLSYPRGRWHAVLTPFGAAQDFLVVDRAGPGVNLEERIFAEPWIIHAPEV